MPVSVKLVQQKFLSVGRPELKIYQNKGEKSFSYRLTDILPGKVSWDSRLQFYLPQCVINNVLSLPSRQTCRQA